MVQKNRKCNGSHSWTNIWTIPVQVAAIWFNVDHLGFYGSLKSKFYLIPLSDRPEITNSH